MKDKREKKEIVVEFNEDNLNRFLEIYYTTHRKGKKPIIDSPLPRSMNQILVITNRIVQNSHKQHRGEYVEFIIKELGLEKLGISKSDLEIEFVYPTVARRDLDNYLGGIKEYMDSFTDLGVICDDSYDIIQTITAKGKYEKGCKKTIMTFKNCEYDKELMENNMAKEKAKREKRETTMEAKKKEKKLKKTTKKTTKKK